MSTKSIYAEPIHVESITDCFFYHFMDVPNAGTVGTTWDLRDCANDYLGQLEYRQKRVLDVGTASGFLTFEMEKRGANVVSFDMPDVESWNFVPHFSLREKWSKIVETRSRNHRRMQNAYWFAHRRLNSTARVHYGDVYNLPLELGNFDVVFMGMILPHLRDPFQALYSASRLASDLLVITNPGGHRTGWLDRLLGRPQSIAKFVPSAENNTCDVWWALTASCIQRMLDTIGFRVIDRVPCSAVCHSDGQIRIRKNLAIVAQRVAGTAEGIAGGQDDVEQAYAA